MITISAPCSFASYNVSTKKLTSSIITIGENTTIMSGADAASTNNDVMFYENRATLIAELKAKGITEDDGSEIIDYTIE